MRGNMNLIPWPDLSCTSWSIFRRTGETMEWKGFRFEIVDMDAQRIDKVLVSTTSPKKSTEKQDPRTRKLAWLSGFPSLVLFRVTIDDYMHDIDLRFKRLHRALYL